MREKRAKPQKRKKSRGRTIDKNILHVSPLRFATTNLALTLLDVNAGATLQPLKPTSPSTLQSHIPLLISSPLQTRSHIYSQHVSSVARVFGRGWFGRGCFFFGGRGQFPPRVMKTRVRRYLLIALRKNRNHILYIRDFFPFIQPPHNPRRQPSSTSNVHKI